MPRISRYFDGAKPNIVPRMLWRRGKSAFFVKPIGRDVDWWLTGSNLPPSPPCKQWHTNFQYYGWNPRVVFGWEVWASKLALWNRSNLLKLTFGLSNFSAEKVEECYDYAKSKTYVLPTVYQRIYGLAARQNEKELFPVLRRLGISIQAYLSLASGFLVKTPADIKSGARSFNHSKKKTWEDLARHVWKASLPRILGRLCKVSKREWEFTQWRRLRSAHFMIGLWSCWTRCGSLLRRMHRRTSFPPTRSWVASMESPSRLEETWEIGGFVT